MAETVKIARHLQAGERLLISDRMLEGWADVVSATLVHDMVVARVSLADQFGARQRAVVLREYDKVTVG